MPVRPTAALRLAVNAVNLSTLLGLAVAYVGRARVTVAHDGLFVARGFTLGARTAPAFTVGNVIILRLDDEALARRPRLLVHEARHATQYAWCIGPLFLPLYLAAAGWSWLRARDFASYNVFERLAGLEDGGYPPPPRRRSRPSRR
ncbi:MAG: hypothetical protein QOH75_3757 [Actinomycetota bacterium]|nr:hypothetical protein [Actinomycetota bacterium]